MEERRSHPQCQPVGGGPGQRRTGGAAEQQGVHRLQSGGLSLWALLGSIATASTAAKSTAGQFARWVSSLCEERNQVAHIGNADVEERYMREE